MTASKNAIDIIKNFEGCVLSVYSDVNGNKTVGYGHLLKNSENSKDEITQEEADNYLLQDIKIAEKKVNKYMSTYNFNQNQFDALVSFAFNIGSIDQLTNEGTRTISEISEKILLYKKSGGKTIPGLLHRRTVEKELFDRKE